MKRFIQILVLFIYLITSCIVMVNKDLYGSKTEQGNCLSGILYSIFSVPMDESIDNGNNLTFLFKDPSDDGSIELNYYPSFIIYPFVIKQQYLEFEDKIQDPDLNIFSPPPQLV